MALASDHRHCKVCGKVTKGDNETCGAACTAERERRVRSAKTYRYALYGAIAILLLVLAVGFV